jgi:hypothetical protein
MFTRTHTINGVVYTEALEAYCDPVTRKPKHRCLVRWPASMSLVEAIADAEGIASLCSRALPRYRKSSLAYQRAVRAVDRAAMRVTALRLVHDRLSTPPSTPL